MDKLFHGGNPAIPLNTMWYQLKPSCYHIRIVTRVCLCILSSWCLNFCLFSHWRLVKTGHLCQPIRRFWLLLHIIYFQVLLGCICMAEPASHTREWVGDFCFGDTDSETKNSPSIKGMYKRLKAVEKHNICLLYVPFSNIKLTTQSIILHHDFLVQLSPFCTPVVCRWWEEEDESYPLFFPWWEEDKNLSLRLFTIYILLFVAISLLSF